MPAPDRVTGGIGRDVIRGMVWLCLGSLAVTATLLLRTAARDPLSAYGPFIPLLAGAYLLILGIEKLVFGFRAMRRLPGPSKPRLFGTRAGAGLLLLVVALAAPSAAWMHRRPYWDAVEKLNAGEEATQKLRTIAERHAAAMQEGAVDASALEAWRTAATTGAALRPMFAASLDAARYLSANAAGAVKQRAEIDVRYYALCLEWMDLYDQVTRTIGAESMVEPPDAWAETQNGIIERIQALPTPP